MNGSVRRMPVWLAGVAVAAAGLVMASPGTPAFACGEQTWAASGDSAPLQTTAALAGTSPVQVSGGGQVHVPAGGAAPLSVTVANTGRRFTGSIDLEVRTSGPSTFPAMTMELQVNGERTITWKRLAEEGTPSARWFRADGLSFQAGEVTTGFRLGVPADALGARLRITAHVRDSATREVGATRFDVTVSDAEVRVRTTFPAELRRGAAYREFDVVVGNPSTRTYHNVRASLSLTGLTGVPTPREAGALLAADVRLERRSGGSWHRLAVLPGCDPVSSATIGGPFDLDAGASRTLQLRIRLAASSATKPHPAQYWLYAGPQGHVEAQGSVSGNFLIQPRQLIDVVPTVPPTPTHSTGSAAPMTAPATPPTTSTATPPAAAPASLPDTGQAIWPLAGAGIVLLLGGTGVLVVAARRGHLGRH